MSSPANPYEAYLRRVPLFRELPPPLFAPILKACQVRRYAENDLIYQQGDLTGGLYLLIEGEAALLQIGKDGLRRQIGTLRGGQFVHVEALFQEAREGATLKAVLPTHLLFLSRADLTRLLSSVPNLPAALGISGEQPRPALKVRKFVGQRPNEQVLLFTHRHWWAYWRYAPFVLGYVVVLLILAALLPPLSGVILLFALVTAGGVALYGYLEWVNDDFVITDQRVVRIQHEIFPPSEQITEVLIDSVQEARVDKPGVIAEMLDYGNIAVITAGDAGNFILDFIPQPESIQQLLMYDRHVRVKQQQADEKAQMRSEMAQWIGLDQAKQASAAAKAKQTKAPPPPTRSFVFPLRIVYRRLDGSLVFRKHWLVWLRAIAAPGVILGAATIVFLLLLFSPTVQELGIVLWAFWCLLVVIGGAWFLWVDWDWRHDELIIGDFTITIIHQRPFWLQNEQDKVMLKQVDNVVAESRGLLPRFFNYGTLKLSLVGADAPKIFAYAPRPNEIQNEIMQRQSRVQQQAQIQDDQAEKDRLREYFAAYHDMMGGTAPNIPAQAAPPTRPVANPNLAHKPGEVRDRSRPPRVPQQRNPDSPRPTMTAGKPYTPAQKPVAPPQLPNKTYEPAPQRIRKMPPDQPPPPPESLPPNDAVRPPRFPPRRITD
jgi:hypothetical protein